MYSCSSVFPTRFSHATDGVCADPQSADRAYGRDDAALAARPLVFYMMDRGRALVYAALDDTGVTVGMPLHRARALPAGSLPSG
jgi:hypothetical protein